MMRSVECTQVFKSTQRLKKYFFFGLNLLKEYVKAVYCHPAYLTYMQSTSCEIQGWMNHKLKLKLPGEISTTSDMQMIPPLRQKVKRN